MPFDDEAPTADTPGAVPGDPASVPAPPTARRRRTPRAWSSPVTPIEREERFDGPISESAWGAPSPAGRAADRLPPPPGPIEHDLTFDAGPGLGGAGDDATAAVEALGAELRAALANISLAVTAAARPPDAALVTGAEMAATIETLGAALGNGMAGLLSDHRALLARDVEAAADRILDELAQRLRATSTQTVEGVEERVRHVTAKGFGGLGEQFELRLDQLQADVNGLRAVMLEIPDQTMVTRKLDQLADTVGTKREQNRLSPAMSAGIEKAVAGPIGRLEAEIASLRRRISLRSDPAAAAATEPDPEPEAAPEVAPEVAPVPLGEPAHLVIKADKATTATKAKRATKAAKTTGRRGRSSS